MSKTCPMTQPAGVDAGMDIMANSYAYNAGLFMQAMRAADPSAQLGVPWAFNGAVGGAGVQDYTEWNDTVLGSPATQPVHQLRGRALVSVRLRRGHRCGRHPTAQAVIQSVEQIPADYAKIRDALTANGLPKAQVIVGETGVSYLATNVPCTPTGALFAAGDVLEWLAAGAQSVDWWPLDTDANLGTKCANIDEGMFTNIGTPNTPYIGYLLASPWRSRTRSSLADDLQPGRCARVPVGAARRSGRGGLHQHRYLDLGEGHRRRVAGREPDDGQLQRGRPERGEYLKTVAGTTTASAIAGGITLPAESILVLKSGKPAEITVGAGPPARSRPGPG